jgi:septum formation protein
MDKYKMLLQRFRLRPFTETVILITQEREELHMKKIVLASASPRRRELLSQVGVAFEVKPASGEERITSAEPAKVVEELSRQKAMFTAYALEEEENRDLRDVVVIGADTVVSYEGKILGKPADETDAIEMLAMLQGNTHQVYTGVTLLIREKGRWKAHTFHECTDVSFYPVTEEEIKEYVNSKDPMDKAGSYGIQGAWGAYVKGIRGDYNNVVGLPVARLIYETKKLGMNLRG